MAAGASASGTSSSKGRSLATAETGTGTRIGTGGVSGITATRGCPSRKNARLLHMRLVAPCSCGLVRNVHSQCVDLAVQHACPSLDLFFPCYCYVNLLYTKAAQGAAVLQRHAFVWLAALQAAHVTSRPPLCSHTCTGASRALASPNAPTCLDISYCMGGARRTLWWG